MLFPSGQHQSPPAPDTTKVPRFVSESAVEIRYSRQSHYRAIITTDTNGFYRVRREQWDTGDWEVAGVAFWTQNDRFATITDTLDNARKLADECLAETPDGIDQPNV